MDIFSPVQRAAEFITNQGLGVPLESYWGKSINFFIYDLVKIGLLLVVINHVMAVVRYYFPVERVKAVLARRRLYGLDYLMAALLGVVTPFCSCSSIPLFIGFLSAGIPLGVTFAFMISSPLVNEASLFLFPAMFGFKLTVMYNLMGVAMAVIGGVIIQKLKMEKYLKQEMLKYKSKSQFESEYEMGVPPKDLLKHWNRGAMEITKSVFPYVVMGVAIGALIHGLIPEALVAKYLASGEWWTVPLAVLLGAPLYANSVGVVPIVEALVGKGVAMGTVLAFMTSIVTISIPEGLMLARVMRKQLLVAFFGITISGIILMGYVFNWVW